MAAVGSIIVSIGADTSDLIKGVNRAQTSLAKVGQAAIGIGKVIASAMLAAGTAIAAMAIKGIALGNELARTARIVGLTAAELGALHHAAALSEVSAEQLDKGLQRLGRTVSAADNGLKSAVLSLQQLGLKAEDIDKLPLSEQFIKVSEAMKGMTNQGDKLRVATELFGKSGADLIPLLDEGADSIRRMMEESKALGLQLDETQSRVIQEASDSLDTMKGAFTGLAMQLGATFGPAIKLAAEAIATMTKIITNALPKLSAMASLLLGIRRAAENMGDTDIVVELQAITDKTIKLNKQLSDFERMPKFDGKMDASTLEQVNSLIGDRNDLLARQILLQAEQARRKKEADDLAALGRPSGGGENPELLEAMTVSAQKIEVERSFNEVLLQMRRSRLDEEITVDAQRIEATRSWHEAELQMAQQHEGMLTGAHKEGVLARIAFSKMEAGEKVKSVIGSLVAMTAGIAQHSKKAFEINKLAAIGNAVMNTAQAVTKALASYPPPLSFAMAAAQAAAGAVQISAIKNTQFQGGGTGTTPSAAATPVVNDQPVAGAAGGAGRGGTIRVEGIDSSSLFTGRAMRELLERIQDALKDGGRLVIA